jgi:hypothetical protein
MSSNQIAPAAAAAAFPAPPPASISSRIFSLAKRGNSVTEQAKPERLTRNGQGTKGHQVFWANSASRVTC